MELLPGKTCLFPVQVHTYHACPWYLAYKLAEMRRGHGSDLLPLLDDFTKLVQYPDPRGL